MYFHSFNSNQTTILCIMKSLFIQNVHNRGVLIHCDIPRISCLNGASGCFRHSRHSRLLILRISTKTHSILGNNSSFGPQIMLVSGDNGPLSLMMFLMELPIIGVHIWSINEYPSNQYNVHVIIAEYFIFPSSSTYLRFNNPV